MKKVLAVLAPGFEETEAVTVIDLLHRAGIAVTMAGLDQTTVEGSHDIVIQTDCRLEDIHEISEFDALFLPGGQPGTNNLKTDRRVLELVKEFDRQNKWITAICAAPTVLEAAGIAGGKKLTSYPSEREVFSDSEYLESAVVRDGRLITSRGVGTAIDFGLAVIAQLEGEDTSDQVAEKILWTKTVY